MSYTPTDWQKGDKVTSSALNNMEKGIEDAANPFVVTFTKSGNTYSADKTFSEINTAYNNDLNIVGKYNNADYVISTVTSSEIWFVSVANIIEMLIISSTNHVSTSTINPYIKPHGGIPETDLSGEVQNQLTRVFYVTEMISQMVLYDVSVSGGTLEDLYTAARARKVICYVARGDGFYFPMIYHEVDSNEIRFYPMNDNIAMPLLPFSIIYSDGTYHVNSVYGGVYMLASLYGGDSYMVPMISSTGDVCGFDKINEVHQIGDMIVSLLNAARSTAADYGEATISTQITDSSTVDASAGILEAIGRAFVNGRGSFLTFLDVFNIEMASNLECFQKTNSYKMAQFSYAIDDSSFTNGELTNMACYDGYLRLSVTYDYASDGNPPLSAIMTVHIEKHDATIV